MALESVGIQFRRGDPAELVDAMDGLVAMADGRGWVNIQPWVDEEDLPAEAPFSRAFSNRGPAVPTGTWVPAHMRRRRGVPASLGLAHPAGRFVVRQLAERGVMMPPGAEVRQDHNRRGLVLDLADGTAPTVVVDFIITAIETLATVPVDDRWVAEVLRRV